MVKRYEANTGYFLNFLTGFLPQISQEGTLKFRCSLPIKRLKQKSGVLVPLFAHLNSESAKTRKSRPLEKNVAFTEVSKKSQFLDFRVAWV
jgi:hypothetical protein